jgi:hypothetical protein
MQSKLIAAGAGLFSLGALIGWAITADRWDKKLKEQEEKRQHTISVLRKRCASAEQSNLDYMRELRDLKEPQESNFAADPDRNAPEGVPYGFNGAVEPGETVEETRINLQRLIDNYTAVPEDVETFAHLGRPMPPNDTPPFVIPRETFAWDEEEGDNYSKITLTYYPKDRVLLDDEEDVMDDVNNVVGWKNLNRFGDESGDPEVVFIRCRRLMTDFEVVRDDENDLPAHVKYGMSKDQYEVNKAAGFIKFKPDLM